MIGGACETHRTSGAAEFGERHAANITAEAHQVDQMSVERRNHEAGAAYGDDEVDFVGAKVRAFEAFFGGFATELDGALDVLIICLAKGARLDDVVDGEARMALVALGVVDNPHHGFELALWDVEYAAHVVLHFFAGDGVLWDGGRGGEDHRIRRCGS